MNRTLKSMIAVAGGFASTTSTHAQAELKPEAVICAALAEARSLILSPDRIRLGDAAEVMDTIEGLSATALRVDSCEEHGIALTVYPNGTSWSYSFDIEELGPEFWCGFGVTGDTKEVRYPYCRGK